jgi:hypothetical protein
MTPVPRLATALCPPAAHDHDHSVETLHSVEDSHVLPVFSFHVVKNFQVNPLKSANSRVAMWRQGLGDVAVAQSGKAGRAEGEGDHA